MENCKAGDIGSPLPNTEDTTYFGFVDIFKNKLYLNCIISSWRTQSKLHCNVCLCSQASFLRWRNYSVDTDVHISEVFSGVLQTVDSFVYLFSFYWKYKTLYSQVVVTHTFNFHTQRQRQVVLWVYRDSAWSTEWVSAQSRPHRETLSWGIKDIIHNKRFPYGIFMHWCLYPSF